MRDITMLLTLLAALATLAGCGGNGDDPVPPPMAPENSAPEIDPIADREVPANSSTDPIGFSVDDDMTAPGDLVLVARSNNESLVPDTGLALGGEGDERTLIVTPRQDQTGTALITLEVSDAEALSVTTSFTLTVTPQPASFSATVRAIFDADRNSPPQEINAKDFNDDGSNYDDLVLR